MLEPVDVLIHTALPGHFQLRSCPCCPTPIPSFPGSLLPFPLILIPPRQLLDLKFLLNHHLVLSLAKKPKHPAQQFTRDE